MRVVTNFTYLCSAMVYPATFEQKIGFDKTRQWIGSLCICDMGRELVASMSFSSEARVIARRHEQTREFIRFMEEGGQFPLDGFFDIRPSLKRLQAEGAYLTEAELFELQRSLHNLMVITAAFADKPAETYPELKTLAQSIGTFPEISAQLGSLLDKYGRIKDSASPALAEIRSERNRLSGSITKLLTDILHQARRDGYIEEDTQPTLREGRLVIPVSPVFKRKLGGIVHDTSASGKTVYVEPAAVVESNNRIRILEADEKREIIRLLTECSQCIRPRTEELNEAYRFLGYMDFVRAKALWAHAVDACFPEMVPKPCIYWKNARHPLLEATLRQQHRDIVPLEISLNEHDRILVISGPNAGGKSVCLKTVGLLQYAWQCGLPVPMLPESRVGVFQQILLDIGDEQSIENDLSTYSSHLSNMKYFLKHADAHCLLLIDEFGGGTEPLLGGAIAEAELKVFNSKGAYGVITTHYTNLKHYASNTEGLVSGAMLYDRHQMQPLFQLSIGNPGSSFAIEIARQIGLPESVIQDATELVGAEHINYDKNLQDIVRDKRYWENKRKQIKLKEKKLEEQNASLQQQLDEIKLRQKQMIREAKEEARALLANTNAVIENSIRAIQESKAEKDTTKRVRRDVEQLKKSLREDDAPAAQPVQPAAAPVKETGSKHLSPGDWVCYGDMMGRILEVKQNKATVAIGTVRSVIPLAALKKSNRKEVEKHIKVQQIFVNTSDELKERRLKFKTQLDVRGMRAQEAVEAVMYFMDDAQMVGVSTVRILHGTGTGALRESIRQYLDSLPGVQAHDEHVQLGGAGITVVEL